MSRRTHDQPDSLEMLLDTMCNTFGGIILIALLIALLARDTRVQEQETRQVTENREIVTAQIQQVQQELKAAKARQEAREKENQNPARASLLQLVEQREQWRQESDMLVRQIQDTNRKIQGGASTSPGQIMDRIRQMNDEINALERKLFDVRGLGASLKGRLDATRRGIQDYSNQLAQANARQTQKLRLPREHETTKTPTHVVVRYGRVYPLYLFRTDNVVKNTESINWQTESPTVTRLEPISGRGLDPLTEIAAINAQFRALPASTVYIVFQVYEDSFAQFNAVKEAAVKQRLEYTWEPRKKDALLRLGPGAAAPRPQ